MNPIVHAELSWLTGARLLDRRDRVLVTIAGVAPDLDGLSLLGGVELYGKWHHVLTHGLLAAIGFSVLFGVLGRKKLLVGVLAFLAFHLHLVCDLLGSGPGWSITYGYPFSDVDLFWSGQWNLASWQNTVIGLVATLAVLWCALPLGRTAVELFSTRIDAKVVATLRARFGRR